MRRPWKSGSFSGNESDGEFKVFRPVDAIAATIGANRAPHHGHGILHMDADLDELVARRASPREMRESALPRISVRWPRKAWRA